LIRNKLLNRIGEKRANNFGSVMILEEYHNNQDILVRFIESGNTVKTKWKHFSEGNVKNVYDKSICGVGYVGEGKYRTRVDNKRTEQYRTWKAMIYRCYNSEHHKKHPWYSDCVVCEEWYNFQVFAKWYDENYYEIEGQKMAIDKDILVKNNRVYSPDNCVFVPSRINNLFLKGKSKRGKLPIGVSLEKATGKFVAKSNNAEGRTIRIGAYTNSKEAFEAYKKFKEKIIKQTADGYRELIPNKLYNAMINYTIEISD